LHTDPVIAGVSNLDIPNRYIGHVIQSDPFTTSGVAPVPVNSQVFDTDIPCIDSSNDVRSLASGKAQDGDINP